MDKKNKNCKKHKKHSIFPNKSAVLYFARLNLLTRPGRSLLFTAFFLMVAVSSFVLMAELYANVDDALTKNYSQEGYPYEDETRLDVRHSDGSAFTDEELEEIRALSYVNCVDPWDISNDFNYYMEKGVDYRIVYGYNTDNRSTSEIASPSFLEDDRFVCSSDCLSEEDLAEGELPDELTEIVLYSEDGSQLGRTIRIYIHSTSIWGYNEWCYYDMKVVGLLAQETDQVYFSSLLCHMLSVSGEVGLGVYVGGTQEHIPIIGVDLTGNNVRMSDKYPAGADANPYLTGYQELYLPELKSSKDTLGKQVLELGEAYSVYVETGSKFQQKLLEMSEEFFLELFPMETTEIAVYLTSYGRTDKALRKLGSMGYEAVSTWRVSVDGYNAELVRQRLATIGICSLGLLMLLVLGWLIVRAMLGLSMKNVILLRKLGMKKRTAVEIGVVENGCFGLAGMLLGLAVVWGLWQADVYSMRDLFGYVDWYTYVVYVGYNLIFCMLAILTYVSKCCRLQFSH